MHPMRRAVIALLVDDQTGEPAVGAHGQENAGARRRQALGSKGHQVKERQQKLVVDSKTAAATHSAKVGGLVGATGAKKRQ